MLPTRVRGLRLNYFVEELDFVDRGFSVVCGGPNNLQRDVLVGSCIPREPDCREMTPSKFAHDDIATIVVCFTDSDRVVATFAIIFRVLLFRGSLEFFARR
jgi:hypothetical protein